MPSRPTCSVHAISPIYLALIRAGVEADHIARRLALEPRQLLEADTRLPVDQLLLPMWYLAEELLDDPLVALRVTEQISRERFDVFSYILSACSTIGEAASRAIRYFRLLSDGGSYELSSAPPEICWSYRPANAKVSACCNDSLFALAAVVSYVRLWTSQDFAPTLVELPYVKLPLPNRLEAFFRAPVRLGAPQCAIRFEASILEHPLPSADPKLAQFLERFAEQALAALPAVGQLSGQVRECLLRGLASGETSLKTIARQLAMSERTLQRQLGDEHTTLKQLTEELRRELSLGWLGRPELSLAEIAYLLGFSETAPFARAFKKWTGLSPGEYRRKRVGS